MIKPYIIIPNLIIQPTWGGKYITQFKELKNSNLSTQNIGQSYELYEHTRLSQKTSTLVDPTFEIGSPSNPQKTKITGDDRYLSIRDLISENPKAVLGEKALSIHGNKMGVLIKFTQGKGNSYQLHVKNNAGKWETKPESWYYLEPGIITLGVKNDIDWDKYKDVCVQIDNLANKLSEDIKTEKISIKNGRKQLQKLINKLKPDNFVNILETEKNQGIDLSNCGVHHSWEESEKYPKGNILYEVQKNAYDPVSTIRSFDKGKIKDDGSIRDLQIEEYFKYIDRTDKTNNPNSHIISLNVIDKQSNYSVSNIFTNKNYSMDEISLTGELSNHHTKTTDSFHHIFVRDGEVKIVSDKENLILSKGYSAFIPASIGQYDLVSDNHSVILKTYV